MTVFALLELYRKGEVDLGAEGAVRADRRSRKAAPRHERPRPHASRRCSSSPPQPVAVADLAEATRGDRGPGRARRSSCCARTSPRAGAGIVLREVAGGFALASDPASEDAARRLLAKPRTPPLTQAQAETLAIVAYLQPVSRPEIARIRGVSSESAVQTLAERGLIEESGRSRFGAAIFKTTELFERLFGLSGLDQLPDPSRFDPTPEDERELRERLLKAGEQRGEP